eukprot:640804-Rhodomonas_salina.2
MGVRLQPGTNSSELRGAPAAPCQTGSPPTPPNLPAPANNGSTTSLIYWWTRPQTRNDTSSEC